MYVFFITVQFNATTCMYNSPRSIQLILRRISSFEYARFSFDSFNQYLTNVFPIIIIREIPLSFLGVSGVIFEFYLFFR